MLLNKSFKFYIVVALIAFLALSFVGAMFFNIYLGQSAQLFGESFQLQNANLLESAEVLQLSQSLENSKKTGQVGCILGSVDNKIFYSFDISSEPNPHCASRLLSRTVVVQPKGNQSLSITFLVHLPLAAEIVFIAYLILNLSILSFVVFWIRKQELHPLELNQRILKERELVFKQVAHDIRSPLSTLNILCGALNSEEDEKKLLLQNAIKRINDIAEDLLQKGQAPLFLNKTKQLNKAKKIIKINDKKETKNSVININKKKDSEEYRIDLIKVIEQIFSEKKIEYSKNTNIVFDLQIKNVQNLFLNINQVEFSRVLSNLINNSVESFSDSSGEVLLSLTGYNNKIQLLINDNGKGIPEEMMNKIGTEGFSYGKINSTSGNGLGIYYAKKLIHSWNGQFEIISKVGLGTSIQITLPVH